MLELRTLERRRTIGAIMLRKAWPLCLFLLGCGRPVTEQECSEIVGRIAELELKQAPATGSAQIAAEVKATQAAFHDEAMKDCVGKRVTEGALTCVRNATTAKQIVEECFD
jgi:hypothetical protein